jgi:hypothetical protein
MHIIAFVARTLLPSSYAHYRLCHVHIITFVMCTLSPLLCAYCRLHCAHVVAFIIHVLLPLSHARVPSICVVEPVAAWIVCLVMVADATVAVAADVAGGSLAGGLSVDLVAVGSGRLGFAGGGKGSYW